MFRDKIERNKTNREKDKKKPIKRIGTIFDIYKKTKSNGKGWKWKKTKKQFKKINNNQKKEDHNWIFSPLFLLSK